MTDDVPASQRWRGRPVHSLLLQAFVFAVPVVASVAAATAVSIVAPKPTSPLAFVAWWIVLTAIALVVLVIVDRMARKLLPLATLLKLSMLFPDRAPSRFRVARNAASVRKLQEQLAEARERGLTAEPVWAAETVLTLITALGHHDRRSRGHSERVHVYAELLAEELDLPEYDRDRLRWAALLHDVGKLVIPSDLLNKPGAPDDEEWDALRTHPQAGAELCAPLLGWLGEWGLAIAQHHEWFDGTGYPLGLSGTQISRAARIVAVADCYEVMTTSRTYKRALNPANARKELARCAGTQFDPAIVRAFLNISLGRLRLAMGPLAMLSTVPSMARLSSLLEPIARAGAVIGGAAILIGGGTVLPDGATAQPTVPGLDADVAHAKVVEAAAVAAGEPQLSRAVVDGVPPAAPPAEIWGEGVPRMPGDTTVASTPRTRSRADKGRTAGTTPVEKASGPTPPRNRTKAAADQPATVAAPDSTTTKTKATAKKSKAKAKKKAGDRGRRPGGANPTPPTAAPGLDNPPPDAPPANPNPPSSDRAKGRDL